MNGTWQGGRATAVTYSILKENLNNNIPKGWNHTHTKKKRRRDSDQGATAAIVSFSIYWSFSFGFFEACFLFSFLYISGTYSLFVLRNLVLCTLRYSSFLLLFVDLWFCHTSFFLCIQLVFFFCVTALFFPYLLFRRVSIRAIEDASTRRSKIIIILLSLSIYFSFSKASLQTNRFYCFFFFSEYPTSLDNFLLKKGTLGLSACVCVCL